MTEFNPMDIHVETNEGPIKGVEMVSTESTIPDEPESKAEVKPEALEPKEAEKPNTETKPDVKLEPTEEEKNIQARERLAERIRQTAQSQQPQQPQPAGDAPKIENFSTLEEFLDARDKWASKKGVENYTAQQTQESNQRRQREMQAAIEAKANLTRVKYPDFNSTIQPYAGFMDAIPALSAYINESDMGMEVAYNLAKNPALLEEISRMSPFAAGRQLLKLEEKLKAPPVALSNAPEPIKPVGSRETVKPRLSQMSDGDFIRERNRQELASKRLN
jgi:hypothetical protein